MRRWFARWSPPLAFVAMLALLFLAIHGASIPDQAPIRSVEAAPSEATVGDEPPLATHPWQRFDLPLRTCKVRCETPFIVIRHRFVYADQPGRDWALYLPFFDANVAVYLNGRKLDKRGRMQPPADLYRYHSRLVFVPSHLLRQGENELLLQLVHEIKHIGGLSPFYLGPNDGLAKAQRWRAFLTESLVAGIAWLQAGSLVLVLALILTGRRENVQFWYLLVAPFWLMLAILHVSSTWPVPGYGRWFVMWASLLGVMCITPLFIIAIVQTPARWLVRAIVAFLILGLALIGSAVTWMPLEPYWRYQLPNLTLKLCSYVMVPWMLWLVARNVLARTQSRTGPWLLVLAGMPAILGIADALRGTFAPPLEVALLPVAALGIVLALWVELAHRFANDQRSLKAHAQTLSDKVQERERQLAESYERQQQADRERALIAERQRLMRDMHDGVGGQLASLVHLASNPATERAHVVEGLREGLADLRLILDSLAGQEDDLLVALGRLRHRVEPTLESAGLRLHWDIDPALDLPPWPPEAVLHLYRIVQEATHNAIRHAQATQLRVSLRADAAKLCLEVVDDGIGMAGGSAANDATHDSESGTPGSRRDGYGIASMRERARKLGASLDLQSEPGKGTAVRLVLPGYEQPPTLHA